MRPLVIGHAAAAGEAPANTLAGVRRCLLAGVDAMEIDVQVSLDGVPVLMHDTTVDRTTNLSGEVRALPLASLAAADAGDGEPVPALDDVLDLVDGRFTVMCELKATPGDPEHDRRVVEAVVAVIRRHDALQWTAIHSFNPLMVERSRAVEPRISTAIISPAVEGTRLAALLASAVERGAQAVSLHHACIDDVTVLAARRRQVTPWTWTVDEELDWARVARAGVAGIITNRPRALADFLAGAG